MRWQRRLTLGQLFLAAAAACLCIVGGAVAAFWRSSERAALAAAEHSRRAVARDVEGRVAGALGAASDVLDDVERALTLALVVPSDPHAVEVLLAAELLADERLSEVTFTAGRALHRSEGQRADQPAAEMLSPEGRFQVSVVRGPDGALWAQHVERRDSGFFERRSLLDSAGRHRPAAPVNELPALDPTLHPTFVASVGSAVRGEPVWSDLHFSELDGARAPSVVLTVQKALRTDGLVAVVRVGVSSATLDAITRRSLVSAEAENPHVVALLAVSLASGGRARLVTRVSDDDPVVSFDDELRVEPRASPPVLGALLDGPLLSGPDPEWPEREAELTVGGVRWLVTLSPLSIAGGGTRGWMVAVLVPREYYTRELNALGGALSLTFGASLALVFGVLGTVIVACRRGLAGVGARAARMRQFDFAPEEARSVLVDIDDVLESLERAKTVARAMGKYIPLPLVRTLYERNRDPELGGQLREVSLMFSDIQGFTTLAERLAPDALARCLGRYLEVMTTVLEQHGATIDKYIGDAVMAIWNAPAPLERHSLWACRAVLACQRALAALYASPEWDGLPPLVTRFGVHRASVFVGHFGTPSRMSYTALGDGVNLAARLESECKCYGVRTLVSAAVLTDASPELAFRPVDRVIVRGKSEPVDVYELLDEREKAQRGLVPGELGPVGAKSAGVSD